MSSSCNTMEVTYKINGEALTFKLTAEDKKLMINACTQNKEREWILEDIDEKAANTITSGAYALPILTSILERYLVQCTADADVKVDISIESEDLVIIMTIKEKWTTRVIKLTLNSTINGKILRRDIKSLEDELKKTKVALAETTERLSKLQNEPKPTTSAAKDVVINGGDHWNRTKVYKDVCAVNLTKGSSWLVLYTIKHKGQIVFNVMMVGQVAGKDPWSEYTADVDANQISREKIVTTTGSCVIDCGVDIKLFLRITSAQATLLGATLTAIPTKLV